jgi:hypothetical protein
MAEDAEAFLEVVVALANERGYHDMAEEELERLGHQALLDCVAVFAALGPDARKRFALAIAKRLKAAGA